MSSKDETTIQAVQEQSIQIHEEPVELVMENQVLEVPQAAPQEIQRLQEDMQMQTKLLGKIKDELTKFHDKLMPVPKAEYFPERTAEFQQTNEECKVASTKKAARKKTLKTQQDLDKQMSENLAMECSSINVNLTARNSARNEIAKAEFRTTSPTTFRPELLPRRNEALKVSIMQGGKTVATHIVDLIDKSKITKNAVPTAGLENDGKYGYGRRDLTGYERRENEKKLSKKAKGAKAGSSVEKTAKKDVQNLFLNMYVDLGLKGEIYVPNELQDAIDSTYFSELFQNDIRGKSSMRMGTIRKQIEVDEGFEKTNALETAVEKAARLERIRENQQLLDTEKLINENLEAIFLRIKNIGTNNLMAPCDNLRQIDAMDKARAVLLLDEPSEYRDLMIKVLDEKQATMRIEHQAVINLLVDPAPPSLRMDGTVNAAGRVAPRMNDLVRELANLARQVPTDRLQTEAEQLATNQPAYDLIMQCARESQA